MKGLALILGKAASSKGNAAMSDDDEEESPDSSSETGSSAKEYARLAAEAIADKDFDGAAEALVSLVRAVK